MNYGAFVSSKANDVFLKTTDLISCFSFALVLSVSSRTDEAERSVLVHTIALELIQRDVMQGEGRSKKGTETSLKTHSFTKQSQHNKQ